MREKTVESHQEPGPVGQYGWLARAVAGTYAIITLGFLYSAVLSSMTLARRPSVSTELAIGSALRVLITGLLLYLTVRAYRRPTLLLCCGALVYILGDWSLEVYLYGSTDLFSKYWTQIVGTAFALVGLYGTVTGRRPPRYRSLTNRL
jgi:hypothetical protein